MFCSSWRISKPALVFLHVARHSEGFAGNRDNSLQSNCSQPFQSFVRRFQPDNLGVHNQIRAGEFPTGLKRLENSMEVRTFAHVATLKIFNTPPLTQHVSGRHGNSPCRTRAEFERLLFPTYDSCPSPATHLHPGQLVSPVATIICQRSHDMLLFLTRFCESRSLPYTLTFHISQGSKLNLPQARMHDIPLRS
jgi:hypothetical protein